MRKIHAVALSVALGLVFAGCSSGGGENEPSTSSGGSAGSTSNGGTAGTGGTGAGSGGSAGTSSSGPAITSAPPAWVRPADCGGVGELCPNLGCPDAAPSTTCQSLTNTCIPWDNTNNMLWGKSMERPYCLAYTCMTFDEASCFCTGPAAEEYPQCASGPAGVAGLCAAETASCASKACCEGYSCVEATVGAGTCYETCATNADCDTGCCTDLKDTGQLVCAPLSACENPCGKRGEACGDADPCCRGVCVDSTNPEFAGCRPSCTSNEQCDTGCCRLFADSTNGFCADASFCSCLAAESPCGQNEPPCCEGSSCVTWDDGATFVCAQHCMQESECASGCCTSPFEGENYGACCE